MDSIDTRREAEFRTDYAIRSRTIVRFGLALGAILYTLFAPLDVWMLPESWRMAFVIHFAVLVPACLGALVLTFTGPAKRMLQLLASDSSWRPRWRT
jgi:hypothetical protein